MRLRLLLAVLPFMAWIDARAAQDHSMPPRCSEVSGFQKLDFWVGEWDVYVGEQKVGHNLIEKTLEGCAIFEHWTDAEGNEGKSLFFYNPVTDSWKQVWVTEYATARGGVKEKTLVESLNNGSVRFRGEIPLEGGESYLDRTTLTPLPGGKVRQHIEISRDGETWQSTFDAVYVKKSSSH